VSQLKGKGDVFIIAYDFIVFYIFLFLILSLNPDGGCWKVEERFPRMDFGNTNWKIYCSEPGIASTNNALESFNNLSKKSYTLNTRHTLSALIEIFTEQLVFNVSMDIKELKKCYETSCLPAVAVKQ
jgi:hypothetical protein